MRVIEPLALHRTQVPRVAEWLRSEWSVWYGVGGGGDAHADASACGARMDALPLGVLALDDGVPVGFGALKTEPFPPCPTLGPWVGAGFVRPDRRGQGIGAPLLDVLAQHASRMGHERVCCATASARSLLQRAGWVLLHAVLHDGTPTAVFASPVPSARR